MNYQSMTLEEILRVAVPETELEKVLFQKIDLDYPADEEYEELERINASKQDDIEDLEIQVSDLSNGITMALASIAEGNIDKARQIPEDI